MGIVDGGTLEDVSVPNITLRDPYNHPLFVDHDARLRAPYGTPVGRVRLNQTSVTGADSSFPCGVKGLVEALCEDVTFRDVDIFARGGGTRDEAARIPKYCRESSLEVIYLETLPAAALYA